MAPLTAGARHRLVLIAFAVLACLRVAVPLDLAEAVVLTRSEIPAAALLLSPYSPGYLFLLHLWAAAGSSAWWLHSLGLGLGLAGLALVPPVARSLGGAHAESGALWILALSPFFARQMVSVTPAALAFLAVVASLLFFLEYQRRGQLPWLAGWVAVALLSLLIHGGLYYLVLVLGLASLVYRGRSRPAPWWLAQLPPLALFGLLSGAQFERFLIHRLHRLNETAAAASQWGSLGGAGAGAWPAISGAVLAALVGVGLYHCRDWRRTPRHALLALGAGVPCAIWLVWLPHDFYAVGALPFLAVLASMGLRGVPRWARQVLWACLLATYGWGHWQSL